MKMTFPSRLCTAIRIVETGGHPDPANAVGAAGEIGPLQITEAAWIDALEYNPSIGGEYQDCRDLEYSQQIFLAYLDRYSQYGDSSEVLARIWNGGPNGHTKESTKSYWGRVQRAMALARDCEPHWDDGRKANQQGAMQAGGREGFEETTERFGRRSVGSGLDD